MTHDQTAHRSEFRSEGGLRPRPPSSVLAAETPGPRSARDPASPGARTRGRRPAPKLAPRLKVWVVFGERVKFGDGRAELLEEIDELGSFKKAVARFGMSYRNAWGYFRELERASGITFLERHPGRGPEGGTRLTAEGRRCLRQYRRFRRGLDELVTRHFTRSFGGVGPARRRRPR